MEGITFSLVLFSFAVVTAVCVWVVLLFKLEKKERKVVSFITVKLMGVGKSEKL